MRTPECSRMFHDVLSNLVQTMMFRDVFFVHDVSHCFMILQKYRVVAFFTHTNQEDLKSAQKSGSLEVLFSTAPSNSKERGLFRFSTARGRRAGLPAQLTNQRYPFAKPSSALQRDVKSVDTPWCTPQGFEGGSPWIWKVHSACGEHQVDRGSANPL